MYGNFISKVLSIIKISFGQARERDEEKHLRSDERKRKKK